MKFERTNLPEVCILTPRYFEDDRGYFCETYSKRTLSELGITEEFVQDNHSMTRKKGTIRGIHCQKNPSAQGKLVRCTKGRIMDVAVDLRCDSPNYKKWISVELSAENRRQLWIPAGFGHAFLSLEDDCEVQYKATSFYDPQADTSILWCDPEIGVDWRGVTDPILSAKDAAAKPLKESNVSFCVKE